MTATAKVRILITALTVGAPYRDDNITLYRGEEGELPVELIKKLHPGTVELIRDPVPGFEPEPEPTPEPAPIKTKTTEVPKDSEPAPIPDGLTTCPYCKVPFKDLDMHLKRNKNCAAAHAKATTDRP